jgi:hypothetical protein
LQREGDRSEITGVTWKNKPERCMGGGISGKAVDSLAHATAKATFPEKLFA